MNHLRPAAALALLAVCATCGGNNESAPAGPPPGATRVDESKAGRLTGRVVLTGDAPANPPIKLSADPFCAGQHPNGATFENFVVKDGGLENVFVYVKDGLGNYYFDLPSEPAKLDQQACQYRPHVLGVRVGQPLEISNSDETMHNVHAMPETNREFNLGQPIKRQVDRRTFTAREVMVPFKCNVHSWMQAFVGVMDHPYFAVTHDGGTFALERLPAGTYTVEAWHEKLGTQTQKVTLGEKQSSELTFTFNAQGGGREGAVKGL
ncbi:MAG: carboxypeptidase regulatory-like domain-containing protein [Acidobacteriota bacterium]|nr:carboxypeptidase regulatory-like domain-containing protein [Acidobacteriota bacterium]